MIYNISVHFICDPDDVYGYMMSLKEITSNKQGNMY